MKIEQRFIACDGKEFKTREDCVNYEKTIGDLPDIITSLKKIREICHKQANCDSCMFYNDSSEYCLLKEEFPEYWDLESIGD